MKLRALLLAAMLALASPAGAQRGYVVLTIELVAEADTAQLFEALPRWGLAPTALRWPAGMQLRGARDSMPRISVTDLMDSLKTLRRPDSTRIVVFVAPDELSAPPPPDSAASELSGLMATGFWHVDALRGPGAWALGIDGTGVKMAVADAGADPDHPEFGGRVTRCVSFTQMAVDSTTPGTCKQTLADCNHHGPHVTSSAGGSTRSVAPGVELFILKIFEDVGGDCLAWGAARVRALWYAQGNGAHVINYSTGSGSSYHPERTAVAAAKAAGIVVVGAAGNDGGYQALWPGADPNAVSVGAVTSTLVRASYSNRDTFDLDFMGPGSNVNGAIGSTGYGGKSGTSMAAPNEAAVFALVRQACPTCSVDSLYALVKASAKDLGAPGRDPLYGWGFPRADRAVALALGLSLQPTSTVGTAHLRRGSSGCLSVDSSVEWATTGSVPGVTLQPAACGLSYTVAADAPLTDPTHPPSITLIGVP